MTKKELLDCLSSFRSDSEIAIFDYMNDFNNEEHVVFHKDIEFLKGISDSTNMLVIAFGNRNDKILKSVK